jgi:magnesium-transporting ATPase (P-type)
MLNKLKNKISLAALTIPAYAADSITLKNKTSDFGQLETMTVPGIISGAISLVLIVVAIVFFFILVMGGLKWVTSGGDEKKVGAARAQITNALIGLAIVFAAWAIMSLIGTVFGINILNGLTIPSFV